MDADDRIMAYFTLISLFRLWCLKNTKHQETAHIVEVVTKCKKKLIFWSTHLQNLARVTK